MSFSLLVSFNQLITCLFPVSPPSCRPKSTDTSPFNDSAVWDSPLELGSAADDLDCSDQNHVEEPLDFQAQLQFPDDLKEQKVRVSHVNSPSSFYVQFAQNKSQLIRS